MKLIENAKIIKEPVGKRTYVVVSPDGTESGAYTGKQPRQAALKAINALAGSATKEKPYTVRLRERGTKKIHTFSGYIAIVDASKNKPKWLPDKIKKPFVTKVGIEKKNKAKVAK